MMVSNTARSKVLDDSLRDIGKTLGVLGEKLVNLADRPHRQFEQAQNRLINRNAQLKTSFKRLGWTAAATVSTFVAGFGEIAREYDKLFYTQQRNGAFWQFPRSFAVRRYADRRRDGRASTGFGSFSTRGPQSRYECDIARMGCN